MDGLDSIDNIDAVLDLWSRDFAKATEAGDADLAIEIADNIANMKEYRINFIQRQAYSEGS